MNAAVFPPRTNTLTVTTPSDTDVQVVRTFNAPRDLVFRAITEPELLKRWMGVLPGWSWLVCEMDVRVGGKYRWGWGSDDGKQSFGFTGEFKEVNRPSRIVHTEHYVLEIKGDLPDYPGEPSINTSTLTEKGGVTTLTILMRFPSKDVRDAAVATGMTDGMELGYDRLQTLITEGKLA